MTDILFSAGQALSVIGLTYGWYLSLICCDQTDELRAARERTALLRHLAVA